MAARRCCASGTTYYPGVQNTNSVAVTDAIEVDFHLCPRRPGLSISSIVYTNISGTNGFLPTWFAPSNDLFQVQWTDSLTPAAWDTFTNPPYVSYNTNFPASPAIAQFNFFDDGSQSGGFGPMRFYRLSFCRRPTRLLTLPPQADYVATVSVPFAVTNTATCSDSSLILNYVLTSSPFTSAMIDTNGIITWTPDPDECRQRIQTHHRRHRQRRAAREHEQQFHRSSSSRFHRSHPSPMSSFLHQHDPRMVGTNQRPVPGRVDDQPDAGRGLDAIPGHPHFNQRPVAFTDTNAPMVIEVPYRLEWLPLP